MSTICIDADIGDIRSNVRKAITIAEAARSPVDLKFKGTTVTVWPSHEDQVTMAWASNDGLPKGPPVIVGPPLKPGDQ